jgi:uncharacterized cupredoxin-like copper-binding protein
MYRQLPSLSFSRRAGGMTLLVLALGCTGAGRYAQLPDLPSVVEVSGSDYAFKAPDSVAAGAVNFRFTNNGPDMHHVVIVPLPDGVTAAEVIADTTPYASWTMLGGPSAVTVGHTIETTVNLPQGRYAMICLIPTPTDRRQHFKLGMIKEFVAVPALVHAEARPDSAASIKVVLTDYTYTWSHRPQRGPVVIEVENRGPQLHAIEFVRLNPGVTTAQAFAWKRLDTLPAPFTIIGGVSTLSPGQGGKVALDLIPGNYVVVCFVPDSRDGRPHVAHGMVEEFTIE